MGILPVALTIAGSDCSGGAGIQADLKTFTVHGIYGMSAISALTIQNTLGVTSVEPVSPELLDAQLEACFSDIKPLATKIGMMGNASLLSTLALKLSSYKPPNIILDPIMVSSSGKELLAPEAIATLTSEVFPLVDLVTPNLLEAQHLWGKTIDTPEACSLASHELSETYHTNFLIKGGHSQGAPIDYLYYQNRLYTFKGQRLNNTNTHGTGCTLSAAIASYCALGKTIPEAVELAKVYLTGAIADNLTLGHGVGPLNHLYKLRKSF